MPKLPIALCLAACLLSACGASPQLPLPSGWKRVPVNSPAAIDEYTAAAAREAASAKEEAQQRQQAAVKSQLAQLKALMAELAPEEPPAGERTPVPARAKAGGTGPAEAKASRPPFRPAETVVARHGAILFRVALGRGETRFAPSPRFGKTLLDAARKAARIDVRGAAGAPAAGGASAGIAKMRAENVRKYLVANGIDIARISTPGLDAGIVNAGAAASADQANRGIDIDVMAADKADSKANSASTNGGLQ